MFYNYHCNCKSSFIRVSSKVLTVNERITIKVLNNLGHSPECISSILKVATRSVKKWINRESVKNSSGQGRPPKTTKEKKS